LTSIRTSNNYCTTRPFTGINYGQTIADIRKFPHSALYPPLPRHLSTVSITHFTFRIPNFTNSRVKPTIIIADDDDDDDDDDDHSSDAE